uniref:Uncharacterized protein n=1 Tax=Chrysemys picta bellii TaxID=8478 RepID=A0A8C3F824_CHRPI
MRSSGTPGWNRKVQRGIGAGAGGRGTGGGQALGSAYLKQWRRGQAALCTALSAGVASATPIGHGSRPMGAAGAACRAPWLPLRIGARGGTCCCFWETHGAGHLGVCDYPFEAAFRQKRNERERRKEKCVNKSYAWLQAAIRYIRYLQDLLSRTSEGAAPKADSTQSPSLSPQHGWKS